jgi:hypothetical protein
MTVVVDIYKGTSSSCLDLSAEDVKTLFGNSDQIVQFSMDFQDALKQASKSVYVLPKSQRWQSKRGSRSRQASISPANSQSMMESDISDDDKDRKTRIGEAFMAKIGQMEKVYTEYLKNHDAANKTLEMLLRNKNVSIWLKECREWASDLTAAWNLDSLLVKPVQRILKYPLLLTELLSATPSGHPDHAALADALRATTSISVRINDMKKRADLVGQVVSNRKRKESDVRAGLSKAFGRRTEKLKQHVGLTDMFADKEFDSLFQRFGDNFFQLQLIMRDVELYTTEAQNSMNKFNEFIVAIEGYMTVAPSNYPELESKWCRFRLAVRDVMTVALGDHVSFPNFMVGIKGMLTTFSSWAQIASVRKSVIFPIITLLKLHDGPQRLMQKRNKRLMDYVRFKAIKDRGDKPDRKTTEQGEQFLALNVTLKEELPKLFALTAKLMEACLNNFIQIQKTWLSLVEKKLGYTIDRLPQELGQIISDWSGDFSFSEAQVLSLGICNGSMLADAVNLVGFGTPSISNGVDLSSPRQSTTVGSSTNRTLSRDNSGSPKVSHDFSQATSRSSIQSPHSDNFTQHSNGSHVFPGGRRRANSGAQTIPSASSLINPNSRPGTGKGSGPAWAALSSPSLPQLTLDTPNFHDLLVNPLAALSNSGAPPDAGDHQTSPTACRYSDFFRSALPDSPLATTRAEERTLKDPSVMFLAASMFEFNIDRSRREAGYPYLTYVSGEIFDVIGEKGDLWLARNQDDPTHQVGWIWTKHFAKLTT